MMQFSRFRKPSYAGIDFRSDQWFDQYIEYRKRYPLSLDIADPASVGLTETDLSRSSAALLGDLMHRKKQLKMLTMQLIAAAAHSDHRINLSERVLQHHFQKSAPFFTASERLKIKRNFEKGVELHHVVLPYLDWTARRYLLDISLMTLFADKEIRKEEEVFSNPSYTSRSNNIRLSFSV